MPTRRRICYLSLFLFGIGAILIQNLFLHGSHMQYVSLGPHIGTRWTQSGYNSNHRGSTTVPSAFLSVLVSPLSWTALPRVPVVVGRRPQQFTSNISFCLPCSSHLRLELVRWKIFFFSLKIFQWRLSQSLHPTHHHLHQVILQQQQVFLWDNSFIF